MRLIGIWMLAQGVVELPDILNLNPNVKSQTAPFLHPILRVLVGFVLAAFAGRIGAWRDPRVVADRPR